MSKNNDNAASHPYHRQALLGDQPSRGAGIGPFRAVPFLGAMLVSLRASSWLLKLEMVHDHREGYYYDHGNKQWSTNQLRLMKKIEEGDLTRSARTPIAKNEFWAVPTWEEDRQSTSGMDILNGAVVELEDQGHQNEHGSASTKNDESNRFFQPTTAADN